MDREILVKVSEIVTDAVKTNALLGLKFNYLVERQELSMGALELIEGYVGLVGALTQSVDVLTTCIVINEFNNNEGV